MLHPLYTVLVFIVEFGFARCSSTLSPKGFNSYAPVLQISDVSDFM